MAATSTILKVAKCFSDREFLHADVAGEHVFLNMPCEDIEAYLRHYLRCKSKLPHSTSACILVPRWRYRSRYRARWGPLLKHMQLLKEFNRGCIPAISAVDHGKAKSWQLFYDAPRRSCLWIQEPVIAS